MGALLIREHSTRDGSRRARILEKNDRPFAVFVPVDLDDPPFGLAHKNLADSSGFIIADPFSRKNFFDRNFFFADHKSPGSFLALVSGVAEDLHLLGRPIPSGGIVPFHRNHYSGFDQGFANWIWEDQVLSPTPGARLS